MGNCMKKRDPLENLIYRSHMMVRIKETDYYGRRVGTFRCEFEIKPPVQSECVTMSLNGKICHLSSCVISSMDPRNTLEKDCQDGYFYIFHNSSLLTVLFDGHGKEGLAVVEYCKEFMKAFFLQNYVSFTEDPLKAISNIITSCDEALRSNLDIDTSLSGSTCLLCFILNDIAYVGCLGDSRAVLGQAQTPITRRSARSSYSRFIREIIPLRPVLGVAMSVDQKPDIPEEHARITAAGGRIKPLTDEDGEPLGPARVWLQKKSMPGLAMSRSLGDGISKTIGVIAEPVISQFYIDREFIVIASDGLWNVFNNQEAVDFVEKFRQSSSKIHSSFKYPLAVRLKQPHHTHIAHLLAEESRVRWFAMCEDEDVMTDDIAVLVIELKAYPDEMRIQHSFALTERDEGAENWVEIDSFYDMHTNGNS